MLKISAQFGKFKINLSVTTGFFMMLLVILL